jgi:hypothetical protein
LNKKTWKIGELVIIAEKEKAHEVATFFLRKYRDNAGNTLTKIDQNSRIIASFVYRDPQELQDIVQDVTNIPYVKKCSVR